MSDVPENDRLRAENERLRDNRDYWKKRTESAWEQGDVDGSLIWRQSAEITSLRAKNERLRAEIPVLQHVEADFDRLDAENKRLQGAIHDIRDLISRRTSINSSTIAAILDERGV